MTFQFKLGKRRARDAISFRFSTYFDAAALPAPPAVIGKPWLVSVPWDMFGNDQVGDCVWAGAAHETMLWRAESGSALAFDASGVLSDYSAVTGYVPGDPSTDAGTDMQQAAAYRQKTGVLDAAGARHKIDAYVALIPGNVDQLALAAYLFGAAGVGIQLPTSAVDQFEAEEPWSVVQGATIEGGHYVPVVGRNRHGNFLVVTWGRLQAVTPGFLTTYMDEGAGYLSLERLRGTVSPQGFDAATLHADLGLLRATTPAPTKENTTMATNDPNAPIDESKLIVVKNAVQQVLNGITILEVNVGKHVPDAYVAQIAAAAIKAATDFDNLPSI